MKRLTVLLAVLFCLPLLACKPQSSTVGDGKVRLGQACHDDLEKYCSGQKGKERRQCLRQNSDNLTDACKIALASARHGKGDGKGDGKGVCREDTRKFCAGKKGKERRQCLRQNIDQLSDACKARMNKNKSASTDTSSTNTTTDETGNSADDDQE